MDAADPVAMFAGRLSVLSKLGSLAGILDEEGALTSVARLAVPELADWCIVDVVEGELRRVHVAHRDPARAPLADAVRRFPLDHASRVRLPAATAARTGRSVLIRGRAEEVLLEQTEGEYREILRALRVSSVLVVPVTVTTSIATVTLLMTSESRRRYGEEDVALAEELVRSAARAVESARVHRRLRETEERFRVALAHSKITLFEQDADGRYRWVYNPLLGYEANEIVGRRAEELFSPDEAARLEGLDSAVLRRGEHVHAEVQVSERGGDVHHLLISQEPLRGAAGTIAGLTGAATDITDQKRAQEQMAQAVAFREQIMGILGHDLRNPAGAVRALSTLLLRRDDLPEAAREPIAEMGRAGQRMLELIGTLLDFAGSRFTGALPIVPVPTDLHEVCRHIVGELRAARPDRVIELELEGDARGTWDPARMAQVVSNLVTNALQHGARRAPVRVSVAGDADGAVLAVENEGPAIPAELLPALFEPFSRGSARREGDRVRGLGLGLYIVDQVVRAHGGTIDVASTAQRGTAFTVRLPRSLHPVGERGKAFAGSASAASTPG